MKVPGIRDPIQVKTFIGKIKARLAPYHSTQPRRQRLAKTDIARGADCILGVENEN
jgi:hypothetical protein